MNVLAGPLLKRLIVPALISTGPDGYRLLATTAALRFAEICRVVNYPQSWGINRSALEELIGALWQSIGSDFDNRALGELAERAGGFRVFHSRPDLSGVNLISFNSVLACIVASECRVVGGEMKAFQCLDLAEEIAGILDRATSLHETVAIADSETYLKAIGAGSCVVREVRQRAKDFHAIASDPEGAGRRASSELRSRADRVAGENLAVFQRAFVGSG